MTGLLAAAPLAMILIGMGVLRRSAVFAGSIGLALAVVLCLTAFRPGDAASVMQLILGSAAEAVHSTLTILWIIFPALALYEYQRASGAVLRIRDTLASLTPNRRLQAILIAWFFGLFIEGAAGFGTPVALAAPLLVGLGYAPVRAVILALLGHAAGVSFGAIGTPALAQIALADIAPRALAFETAALHALCGPILLFIMVRLAASGPLSRADFVWSTLAAGCFFLPSLVLAFLVGPELPSLGGALIGGALFVALLRRHAGGRSVDLGALLPDLAPYLLILILVLATRLVAPVQERLRAISIGWLLPGGYQGAFEPLYHPGTMLTIGLAVGALTTGRGALLRPALAAALRRLLAVALALAVMLGLSRLMVHAGMIDSLAAMAASVGPAWPLVAPFVGVLGTFITGSATASNILFTELQLSTARSLSLAETRLVAAQGFGAAIGNVVAPHNIIAGSATVGLTGREGDILARTFLPCLFYAICGGALVALGAMW